MQIIEIQNDRATVTVVNMIASIVDSINENIVPFVIIGSLIVIILNLTKRNIVFNKIFLIIDLISLFISVFSFFINAMSRPIWENDGSIGYYKWYIYTNYVIGIIPIALVICWIILFYFYKKYKNKNS